MLCGNLSIYRKASQFHFSFYLLYPILATFPLILPLIPVLPFKSSFSQPLAAAYTSVRRQTLPAAQ